MLSFGSIVFLFGYAQNSIVLIFSSFEFGFLKASKDEILQNQNLLSFLRYSNKFFLFCLFFLAFFVFFVFVFYLYFAQNFDFKILFSMFIYVLGIAFFCLNFAIYAYIESFGFIKQAYFLRSLAMFFIIILTMLFVFLDYTFFALSLSVFIAMFFAFAIFLFKNFNFLQQIYAKNYKMQDEKRAIFVEYFKKNSLGMVFGFLLFQIYTPIVYYFLNSEFAGQVGLSIAIMSALFAISTALLNSKISIITKFISQKEYLKASLMMKKQSFFALFLFIFCGIIGIYLLYFVEFFQIYAQRVVSFKSFLILFVAWILQVVVYALVTFMRCFQKELVLLPTIFSVVYIFVLTIILLKYNPEYLFLGFLTSYFFGIPWIYLIYKNFRKSQF